MIQISSHPGIVVPKLNRINLAKRKSAIVNNPKPPISSKSSVNPRFLGLKLHNNAKYQALPNAPLTPNTVLRDYQNMLTVKERNEIFIYQEIYYLRSYERQQDIEQNDKIYFKFTENDHIKFRYQQIKELGRGAFGVVILCYDHKIHSLVAVKLVKDRPSMRNQITNEKEVNEAISRSSEPEASRFAKYFDYFKFRGFHVFVFEYLGTNLAYMLKYNRINGLKVNLIKIIGKQVAEALKFYHSINYIHCDIKPDNILWTDEQHESIKLIDLGCTCKENQILHSCIQSRYYRAPEVILGCNYYNKIDVWSYGCLLSELYTGSAIFQGENEQEQIGIYFSAIGRPHIKDLNDATRIDEFFNSNLYPKTKSDGYSLEEILSCDNSNLLDLIKQCLQWNPAKGPSMIEILNHPFFKTK
ncbi:CMGC family protein kinase [Trichomonas vaginalis G3]|uniref:dual-specificity kinase n=1 Tax=Trichomonas vaginalis (strain ATCC PRA-98 / G3) TaxID=412133 RepID=A2FFY1_TRIV3|nr:protein kinase protein [Trichomonas vaginalis G3]EAX96191.1 CMGC family protein kinase [Trichomonas vaginalis G3]KAI5506299.1 protein kinase protein [Trichomonas vaginalis G3]|eukprot:XP_001309121.1 CMGC family protein kinase [Trichomonas vaginalis G3]